MSTVSHTTYSETQTVSADSLNTIQTALESASGSIDNSNIRKESLNTNAVSYTVLPVRYWATCQSHSNTQLAVTSSQTITGTTATIVQSIHGSKNCTIEPDTAIAKGEIVRISFHWEVQEVAYTVAVSDRFAEFFIRTVWTTAGTIIKPYSAGSAQIGSWKQYANNSRAPQGEHRIVALDTIFTVPSTDTLEEVHLIIQNNNGSGSDFATKLGDGSMTVQVYNR
tara:strand:+ start:2526 stop:3197 length:672 start_codon:yes stop_codon:yes gene_type:complete